MSEIEKSGGSAIETYDPNAMTGLEDFDANDAVMPRLKIVGKEAMFEDNLSGEKHEKIRVILLGLVKQRILWAPEVDDGEGPLCRSLNFEKGLPFIKEFPFAESGFPAPAADAKNVELPCNNCALKEWGSNPKGSTPWCSEQHTFPLLMQTGEDAWMPAILTLQRSGIKASKAYISSYVRAKQPLYTAVTEISLQGQKRGQVEYATPIFRKEDATPGEEWPVYAQQYRQIREFLQTPRLDEDGAEQEAKKPAAAAAPATPYGDDDEPPF